MLFPRRALYAYKWGNTHLGNSFKHQACVLTIVLVIDTFSVLPDLAEMFPLTDGVDAPEVPQYFNSSESLLSKMTDAKLSDDQMKLLRIIRKYPALFDIQKHNMNRVFHVKHYIHAEGHPSLRQRLYRVSSQERSVIQTLVDDMLQNEFVLPSSRTWASPVVFVKKENNFWWLCVYS